MTEKKSSDDSSRTRALNRALRSFGTSLEHIPNLHQFSEALEKATSEALFLRKAAIHMAPDSSNGIAADHFKSGSIVFPLQGREKVHGAMEIRTSAENGAYSPEDLRLIASLTTFCAALLEHALNYSDQNRNLAILQYILDQLPLPVLACDENGRILIVNTRSATFLNLAKSRPGSLPLEMLPHLLKASDRNGAHDFSFFFTWTRQLVKANVSPCPEVPGRDKVYCLTMIDLTPERERVRQGLEREAFRCRWLEKPLTRVILENSNDPASLMEWLPLLRERLGNEERAGPWQIDSLALSFPETRKKEAMNDLRGWLSRGKTNGITIGVSEMDPGADRPESIAESPPDEVCPLHEFLRPAVLLHDDHPDVNDALEYVLSDHYRVRKSHRLETTLRLLQEESFDVFFTEMSLRENLSGVELAKEAEALNPGINLFLTGTSAELSPGITEQFKRPPTAIRKPFDIPALKKKLYTCLLASGTPPPLSADRDSDPGLS